jgi:hypothetical protein
LHPLAVGRISEEEDALDELSPRAAAAAMLKRESSSAAGETSPKQKVKTAAAEPIPSPADVIASIVPVPAKSSALVAPLESIQEDIAGNPSLTVDISSVVMGDTGSETTPSLILSTPATPGYNEGRPHHGHTSSLATEVSFFSNVSEVSAVTSGSGTSGNSLGTVDTHDALRLTIQKFEAEGASLSATGSARRWIRLPFTNPAKKASRRWRQRLAQRQANSLKSGTGNVAGLIAPTIVAGGASASDSKQPVRGSLQMRPYSTAQTPLSPLSPRVDTAASSVFSEASGSMSAEASLPGSSSASTAATTPLVSPTGSTVSSSFSFSMPSAFPTSPAGLQFAPVGGDISARPSAPPSPHPSAEELSAKSALLRQSVENNMKLTQAALNRKTTTAAFRMARVDEEGGSGGGNAGDGSGGGGSSGVVVALSGASLAQVRSRLGEKLVPNSLREAPANQYDATQALKASIYNRKSHPGRWMGPRNFAVRSVGSSSAAPRDTDHPAIEPMLEAESPFLSGTSKHHHIKLELAYLHRTTKGKKKEKINTTTTTMEHKNEEKKEGAAPAPPAISTDTGAQVAENSAQQLSPSARMAALRALHARTMSLPLAISSAEESPEHPTVHAPVHPTELHHHQPGAPLSPVAEAMPGRARPAALILDSRGGGSSHDAAPEAMLLYNVTPNTGGGGGSDAAIRPRSGSSVGSSSSARRGLGSPSLVRASTVSVLPSEGHISLSSSAGAGANRHLKVSMAPFINPHARSAGNLQEGKNGRKHGEIVEYLRADSYWKTNFFHPNGATLEIAMPPDLLSQLCLCLDWGVRHRSELLKSSDCLEDSLLTCLVGQTTLLLDKDESLLALPLLPSEHPIRSHAYFTEGGHTLANTTRWGEKHEEQWRDIAAKRAIVKRLDAELLELRAALDQQNEKLDRLKLEVAAANGGVAAEGKEESDPAVPAASHKKSKAQLKAEQREESSRRLGSSRSSQSMLLLPVNPKSALANMLLVPQQSANATTSASNSASNLQSVSKSSLPTGPAVTIAAPNHTQTKKPNHERVRSTGAKVAAHSRQSSARLLVPDSLGSATVASSSSLASGAHGASTPNPDLEIDETASSHLAFQTLTEWSAKPAVSPRATHAAAATNSESESKSESATIAKPSSSDNSSPVTSSSSRSNPAARRLSTFTRVAAHPAAPSVLDMLYGTASAKASRNHIPGNHIVEYRQHAGANTKGKQEIAAVGTQRSSSPLESKESWAVAAPPQSHHNGVAAPEFLSPRTRKIIALAGDDAASAGDEDETRSDHGQTPKVATLAKHARAESKEAVPVAEAAAPLKSVATGMAASIHAARIIGGSAAEERLPGAKLSSSSQKDLHASSVSAAAGVPSLASAFVRLTRALSNTALLDTHSTAAAAAAAAASSARALGNHHGKQTSGSAASLPTSSRANLAVAPSLEVTASVSMGSLTSRLARQTSQAKRNQTFQSAVSEARAERDAERQALAAQGQRKVDCARGLSISFAQGLTPVLNSDDLSSPGVIVAGVPFGATPGSYDASHLGHAHHKHIRLAHRLRLDEDGDSRQDGDDASGALPPLRSTLERNIPRDEKEFRARRMMYLKVLAAEKRPKTKPVGGKEAADDTVHASGMIGRSEARETGAEHSLIATSRSRLRM